MTDQYVWTMVSIQAPPPAKAQAQIVSVPGPGQIGWLVQLSAAMPLRLEEPT
jgi:hypothetical protein